MMHWSQQSGLHINERGCGTLIRLGNDTLWEIWGYSGRGCRGYGEEGDDSLAEFNIYLAQAKKTTQQIYQIAH